MSGRPPLTILPLLKILLPLTMLPVPTILPSPFADLPNSEGENEDDGDEASAPPTQNPGHTPIDDDDDDSEDPTRRTRLIVPSGDELIVLMRRARGPDIVFLLTNSTQLVLDQPPTNKAEVAALTLHSDSALLGWMMQDSKCIISSGAKLVEAARQAAVYRLLEMDVGRSPDGSQCFREVRRSDLSSAYLISQSLEEISSLRSAHRP